jgi:hypothetical protein
MAETVETPEAKLKRHADATPALRPMEAPLELVAEPVEPLAVTVEKQRARMNRMLAEPPYRVLPVSSRGNGGDDNSGD